MNEVQRRIEKLQSKGWTLVAIANALGNHVNTIEKWKAGDRYPANANSVLFAMDQLAESSPVPGRRSKSKGP